MLFQRGQQQNFGQNNILDNIKAEPVIKKQLQITKIFNIIGAVIGVIALALAFYFQFKLNYFMTLYVSIPIAALGVIIFAVAGLFNMLAENKIDRRLNETAVQKAVAEKYPTNKDVKKWKSIRLACEIGMCVFLIVAIVLLFVSEIGKVGAIVLGVCFIAVAFAFRFTKRKVEVLQQQRIQNIIYANPAPDTPSPQIQQDAVANETVDTNRQIQQDTAANEIVDTNRQAQQDTATNDTVDPNNQDD